MALEDGLAAGGDFEAVDFFVLCSGEEEAAVGAEAAGGQRRLGREILFQGGLGGVEGHGRWNF